MQYSTFIDVEKPMITITFSNLKIVYNRILVTNPAALIDHPILRPLIQSNGGGHWVISHKGPLQTSLPLYPVLEDSGIWNLMALTEWSTTCHAKS